MLPNNGILFLKTLEFLSCPSKHWHSGPIFHLTGILISSFQTLEFWPYFYKLWNFYLYLLLQSLEFWPYPSNHLILALCMHIGFLAVSFYILNFYLIVLNLKILALFLYTLELWPHPSKDRIFGPVLINTGILDLFL